MKTLYISDLDGTLLQPNAELSVRAKRTLNELIEQGMLFSIATARTIASVETIIKDVAINMPIILMNGVCIYDMNKKQYIKVEAFSKNSTHLLLTIIKRFHLMGFAYVIKDGILSTYYEKLSTKPLRDFYKQCVKKYHKPFTQIEDFYSLDTEPLIYFCTIDKKEFLDPIYAMLKDIDDMNCVFYKDNYSVDLWYLEIFSKYASKYHAVEYLRNYLQLDCIVCFGDNHNDLPLFEAGDQNYAVANAIEELREKADSVIGSNNEDGVVCWLKQNAVLSK